MKIVKCLAARLLLAWTLAVAFMLGTRLGYWLYTTPGAPEDPFTAGWIRWTDFVRDLSGIVGPGAAVALIGTTTFSAVFLVGCLSILTSDLLARRS